MFYFRVEGERAVLRLGGCTLTFDADAVALEGCGARFSGEYRGERWRRYLYLEAPGLDAGVLKAVSRSDACGRRGSVVKGSFMLSCGGGSLGGVLVVVTPGFFLYERAILSPGLVTVEVIGEKGFEVVGGRGGLRLVFRRGS